MTTDTENEQQALYTAIFNLHGALREAYWSTADEATGDKITALADACYHILTELNQEDIKSRSDEYLELKQLAENTIVRLKQVKENIEQSVHSVKIATKVANGIEEALKLAAKFFV